MKTVVLTNDTIDSIIEGIIDGIIRSIPDLDNTVIVGIKGGGVLFANLIHKGIKNLRNIDCQLGYVDMTLYRDDPFMVKKNIKSTELPFDITDKNIILADDVIYSGRTIRAAIDELLDFGRPKSIKLAVLIDRGGRELPICPDFTGRKVRASENEEIEVTLSGKNKTVEKILKK